MTLGEIASRVGQCKMYVDLCMVCMIVVHVLIFSNWSYEFFCDLEMC
jgi:hypothetical protein